MPQPSSPRLSSIADKVEESDPNQHALVLGFKDARLACRNCTKCPREAKRLRFNALAAKLAFREQIANRVESFHAVTLRRGDFLAACSAGATTASLGLTRSRPAARRASTSPLLTGCTAISVRSRCADCTSRTLQILRESDYSEHSSTLMKKSVDTPVHVLIVGATLKVERLVICSCIPRCPASFLRENAFR